MVENGVDVLCVDLDDIETGAQIPQATVPPAHSGHPSAPALSSPDSVAPSKANGSSSENAPYQKPRLYNSFLGGLAMADARLVNTRTNYLEPSLTRVVVAAYNEISVKRHAGERHFVDHEDIFNYAKEHFKMLCWNLRAAIRRDLPVKLKKSLLQATSMGEPIFEHERRGKKEFCRLRVDFEPDVEFVSKNSITFVDRQKRAGKVTRKQPPRKKAKSGKGGPNSSTRAAMRNAANETSSVESGEEAEESVIKSEADNVDAKQAPSPSTPIAIIPRPRNSPRPAGGVISVEIGRHAITGQPQDIRALLDL